jgi:hypothetical protein
MVDREASVVLALEFSEVAHLAAVLILPVCATQSSSSPHRLFPNLLPWPRPPPPSYLPPPPPPYLEADRARYGYGLLLCALCVTPSPRSTSPSSTVPAEVAIPVVVEAGPVVAHGEDWQPLGPQQGEVLLHHAARSTC